MKSLISIAHLTQDYPRHDIEIKLAEENCGYSPRNPDTARTSLLASDLVDD